MSTFSNQTDGNAAWAQVPRLIAATSTPIPGDDDSVLKARQFSQPLLTGRLLDTGEEMLSHADAVADILRALGGSPAMQAASYLVYASEHLNRPEEVIGQAFGEAYARLAVETSRLVKVQRLSRAAETPVQRVTDPKVQVETVRKMLLAFSRDLRVVLLRLASRLQTLRWYAVSRQAVPESMATETLNIFAPLANRLGIWQIKWELEDLAFRFLEPETYRSVARLLDEKRIEREAYMASLRQQFERELRLRGIACEVQGRPKHIYSIVRKMRGKSLGFEQVYDLRALRVIVASLADCYTALAWIHEVFVPVQEEFDDYIARPKTNGYRSLHTVVRDSAGRAIEIQIRTREMHEHAEHGVAAHWAYKEAGSKGYAGVSASGDYDARIAVLRQLLAWERDLSGTGASQGLFEDRIYVLTPAAAVVELPRGATPVDFAYSVHTDLGHRCRGARVDGALVPLNTALSNGQMVEVVSTKDGGPSRDWLNLELGYLVSNRARAKVRAWFNARAVQDTVARGREAVEKLLQREGRTALRLDSLATQLGFKSSDDLFEVVGKDEYSLRNIELFLRPTEPSPTVDEASLLKPARSRTQDGSGGVLVVGIDSLLTQLARCCRPAPPDRIIGYVTRGKGVSIHRSDCANFRQLSMRSADRVIQVAWEVSKGRDAAVFPVDVAIEAWDRQGLLRDISEVFARERMNVIGVQTQSVKGIAWMTFTIELADSSRLSKVLGQVRDVPAVKSARRR